MTTDTQDWHSARYHLTSTVMAAGTALERMQEMGMQPSDVTTANAQWTCPDLLALGHELGLWTYVAVEPYTDTYTVRINGRDRTLLAEEVRGWVIGVLDTVAIPVGPFAYREGLEP
jgi:hypothetical protein